MTASHQSFSMAGTSLAGITVLESLSAAQRDRIAARCHGRRYAAGALIVATEDDSDEVFFILSGRVRASHFSESGKEIAFRDQDAGQMFGELSAIDGRRRSASVTAMADTQLAVLARDDFLELVTSEPALALSTLTHVTALVRALSDRVVEFSTLGVRTRIHSELLRLALRAGADRGAVVLDPAPRHTDIASRVSTHREAVSRAFADLDRAGLLARDGARLILTDVEALEHLVRDMARETPD